MFSKPVSVSVVLSIAIFISGCRWEPFSNLSLGDKNPPAGNLKVDFGKYACMAEIGKKVTSYLDGEMNVEQVHAFMNCIRTALKKFETLVEPNADNVYTPKQLADFLNLVYLANQPMTDSFRNEIMEFKVVILGGDNKSVRREEVDKIIELVSFVEAEALDNMPYLQAYNSKASQNSSVDRNYLEQAAAHLHKSTLDLAEKLQANGRTYSLESLEQLVTEAQKFLKWSELHPKAISAEKFVDLVRAHKHLVSGRDDENILPSDWTLMFDSITSMFSAYTNYVDKLFEGPITYGPNLDILVTTVHNVFDLIGRTLDRLPQKTIPFAATDQYIHALYEVGYIPEAFREKSIVDLYYNLVTRALRNSQNQNLNDAIFGFSWTQLTELENEFNLWSNSQLYLSDRAQKSLGFGSIPSEQVFHLFQSALKTFDLSVATRGVDLHDPRGREIERIINNIPPYFRDDDPRAFIVPVEDQKEYDVKNGITNLTTMNVIRALTRLLIRGFGSDDRIKEMKNSWINSGVTEDELESFYELLRGFGEDLHFMDPQKLEAGRKFFIEGKLFAYDSDGLNLGATKDNPDLLSFKLTMEYLATLWSGGKIRDVLYNEFLQKCPVVVRAGEKIPLDEFSKLKVDRPCFQAHFFDNSLNEFSNLPLLQKSFSHLDVQHRRVMLSNLQSIAHIPCEDTRYISLSEFATIATALHYVETLFAIYDRDRNDVLDQYEIMNAYHRFNGYLSRQVTALKNDTYSVSSLKAIFAFLLQKARVPSGGDGWTLWRIKRNFNFDDNIDQFSNLDFSDREKLPAMPEMSVDRVGILNVLRVLAAASPPKMTFVCKEKPPEF